MNFEIAPKETEIKANWNDARFYCFALNVDGKTGWRLPTKEELNEIYESRNDFDEWYYWSSTTRNGCYAWSQYIGDDQWNNGYKNHGYGLYVRAVRGI